MLDVLTSFKNSSKCSYYYECLLIQIKYMSFKMLNVYTKNIMSPSLRDLCRWFIS